MKKTGYVTLRFRSDSTQTSRFTVEVVKPNGIRLPKKYLSPNNGVEQKFTFNGAMPGEYKVLVTTQTRFKTDTLCWIYG